MSNDGRNVVTPADVSFSAQGQTVGRVLPQLKQIISQNKETTCGL